MENISKDIITKAAGGDIEAFGDIYRKTSTFVYNVALRITNNSEDADEVTQDVFMKIYKNLKNFNSLSSLNTWIYRITVNTAINRLKAEKKHTAGRIDYDPAAQPVSQKEVVRNNIDSKEQISVLLNALNPDQRACVVLREIEGLNYKEIANALRININTVRTRLKRAREKLLVFAKKG